MAIEISDNALTEVRRMMTKEQVIQDAKEIVEELLVEMQSRQVSSIDERELLIGAAQVLGTASNIIVDMIKNRKPPVIH